MHFRSQKKLQGEVSLSDTLDSDGEGNALSLMDVISVDDDMLENLDARDSCIQVRKLVEECLEEFYLIPRITGIYDITDKKGSLSWHVQTDRGERRFSIRNRHSDIKVLYDGRVLVRDSDDNRYEIPSLYELDKKSRAKLKSEI